MTEWTLDDGRVGYGLSEYLDQIVDGKPVGLAGELRLTMSTFCEITAVGRVDESTFTADIDDSSFIVRGPNGGYLAALIMRALEARVTDLDGPSRAARSLTIHYPAAPAA